MKKKIIYIFVFIMFLILLLSTTASAKSISANDVESRTYIIGEHMYTRDTNGDYTGRLTTQYIMLGSSTINSKDIGDFIIYYKTPLGEWKDALTNYIVPAPETFDIKYTNGQQTDKVLYGDVDCDGKVTEDDATYLLYHTIYPSEYELTEEGKINADVNVDGKINSNDASIIQKHVKNEKGYETLPYTGSSIKYGDINGDGVVNSKADLQVFRKWIEGYVPQEEINLENADLNVDGYVTVVDFILFKKYIAGWWPEKNLPEEPLGISYSIEYIIENGDNELDFGLYGQTLVKPTDPKKEGYTFDGWYKDEKYKTKFEFGNVKLTENMKLYGKFIKIQYGDANCDGEINTTDCTDIMRYLKEYETLEDFNIANADVNGDGSITEADYRLIGKYIAGYYPEANLPEEPLGETYKIECIVDGQIYNIEYELRGEKYSRPDSPEKEGYIFKGWYLDEEYKTTFSGYKVLKDITLYGKFEKIQYGDVNNDGILDNKDLVRMQLYLEGDEMYEPTENADVNGDGKFTISDYILFMKYLLNCYPEASLPQEPLGKTCMIEYVLEDGNDLQTYAIDYELNGHTISSSRKPKDPEKEGYKFIGWYELASEKNFEFDTTLLPEKVRDYILCAKFVKIGDIDDNGKIDGGDVTYLSRYIAGYEIPEFVIIDAGDVNEDDEIDDVDVSIIQNYIVGNIDKLPYNSGEKYTIKYNLNGGEIEDDRNIETYAERSLPYTLKKPTKEGYVFEGWTGSNGTIPQTKVTIEKETTGNLEYTANWIPDSAI